MDAYLERELRQAFMSGAYRRSDECVSPIGHVVGFWVLLSLATCLFGASVFLPMRQDRQDVEAARVRVEKRLDALQVELTQLQSIIKAYNDDPAINERTALRELNFHAPGQEIIPTQPEQFVETTSSPSPPCMIICPGFLQAYIPPKWLDRDAWIEYLLKPDVRRGMLIAAAFLASAAFVLFAPPAPRPIRIIKPEAPKPQ